MKVAKGLVVGLDYKLHVGDGKIIDESLPDDPLQYLHGSGQIVPGLESALEGMEVGQSKTVVVPAAEGYGEYDPAGVEEVPHSMFRDGVPEAGAEVPATVQLEDGGEEELLLTVKEVKKDTVVIDLNHPLAGKTLHFDVTVKEVRAATPEELEHGHAHDPDGDHDH